MKISDISGDATQMVGEIYPDRVAIGVYDVDIHTLQNCLYPSYMMSYYPILPFFIPLRAMTNDKIENLLTAGKTMATVCAFRISLVEPTDSQCIL